MKYFVSFVCVFGRFSKIMSKINRNVAKIKTRTAIN